jgi:DNA-binding MarR family transcriptional regulator
VSSNHPLRFDPIAEATRQWTIHWTEPAVMAAATSIMRAQQIVLAAVDDALKPHGLTFARWEALVLLSFTRTGSLPLGKMGQRLMIHPTSVTNIIDRLEADGLVVRSPHPEDRRTTLASITPAGRRLVRRATKAVEQAKFGLGSLAADQLGQLTSILGVLREAEGDYEDSSEPTIDTKDTH